MEPAKEYWQIAEQRTDRRNMETPTTRQIPPPFPEHCALGRGKTMEVVAKFLQLV